MTPWSSAADNGMGQGEGEYTKSMCVVVMVVYNPVSTSQIQLVIQTLGCLEPISAGPWHAACMLPVRIKLYSVPGQILAPLNILPILCEVFSGACILVGMMLASHPQPDLIREDFPGHPRLLGKPPVRFTASSPLPPRLGMRDAAGRR